MSAPEEGIDVSNWNELDSAAHVHAGGKSFAYSLVLDGASPSSAITSAHEAHTAALEAAGVGVGPYAFCRPNHDPVQSADVFCSLIGKATLPPVADVEVPGFNVNWIKAWAARVRSHGHNIIGWYTNLTTFRQLGSPSLESLGLDFLWLAEPSATAPTVPCLIWQYGERSVDGLKGQIDVDRFMGDDLHWLWFVGYKGESTTPAVQPAAPAAPSAPDAMLSLSSHGWVELLYLAILKRPVDPAGLWTFVNYLNGGGTVEAVIQRLKDSPEGQAALAK